MNVQRLTHENWSLYLIEWATRQDHNGHRQCLAEFTMFGTPTVQYINEKLTRTACSWFAGIPLATLRMHACERLVRFTKFHRSTTPRDDTFIMCCSRRVRLTSEQQLLSAGNPKCCCCVTPVYIKRNDNGPRCGTLPEKGKIKAT